MSNTITVDSGYQEAIFDAGTVKRRALAALEGQQFDTVVGRGLSGTIPLLTLSTLFGVSMMAVRKRDAISHASKTVEGTIGERWIFVDDFIGSGATFIASHQAIRDSVDNRLRHDGTRFRTHCIGAFLYDRPADFRFRSIGCLRAEIPKIHDYFKDIGQ